MAHMKTCVFFEEGTHTQFEFVLTKYQEALVAKAHAKSSKPENLIKLDKWFQTELPKKIKSRGPKEFFLTHEEIVQCIKWKLARGQFRPRLKDLVQMNTPRVVMQETKKAFRHIYKKNDLESAVQALSNLKGVGPGLASAVLAAGAPHIAPFMADECLLSLPEMEGIDYTLKEYVRLVEKTKECVERLNSQGGNWTPHDVELAVWTHYIARDLKPELLEDMPGKKETSSTKSPAKTPLENSSPPAVAPSKDDTVTSSAEASANDDTSNDSTSTAEVKTNGVNGVHAAEKEESTEEKAVIEKVAEESSKSTVTQEESGSKEETSSNSNDTNAEESTTTTTESNGDSATKIETTNSDSSAADVDKSETTSDNHTETAAQEKATEKPAAEVAAEPSQPEAVNKDVSSSNGVSPVKEVINGASEEHSEKNGVEVKDTPAVTPAETPVAPAEAPAPEKQQNGNSNSITKEDTFNGEKSSSKRSLEPQDSDLSEAKRLKEDTSAAIPHPIQAN